MTHTTEPTIDEQIDELLTPILRGYEPLTVTFMGEIGDDSRVFQMPYSTMRKAIKALIANQVAKASEDMLKDLLFMRNEINGILGQREENMKFYGMRMPEDEANNLAVQALEQLQKTMSTTLNGVKNK